MTTNTTMKSRLGAVFAPLFVGFLLLGGLTIAPHAALAYYGAMPNYDLPGYKVCDGPYDPNCLIKITNYLDYNPYTYSSGVHTNQNSYNYYNTDRAPYYAPNYQNSYNGYNSYNQYPNYSYNSYQSYQPSYNYSYQPYQYSYNYQYQYSYQNSQYPGYSAPTYNYHYGY